MNKKYVSPYAEVKNFVTEDVILTSGTGTNTRLTAINSKTFSVGDSNVSWKDIVNN